MADSGAVTESAQSWKGLKTFETGIAVGQFSSTSSGMGVALLRASLTKVEANYADDGGADLFGSGSVPDLRVGLDRLLITHDQTGGFVRLAGRMGHIKAHDVAWNSEQAAGVYGFLELTRDAGTMTFGGYGVSAGVIGCVETSGTITIDTNHTVAGFAALSKLVSGVTVNGKTCGFYSGVYDSTNWSDGTARLSWVYGFYSYNATTGFCANAGTCAFEVAAVGSPSATGFVLRAGISGTTLTSATAGNAIQLYITGSAATGTYRGIYSRLYLSNGAGGEAVRAFTTVSNNTPTDTVNGIHASLNFGASAGNISGLGTAGRFTLHIPNRALLGTFAAIQAEIWTDGASSSIVGATEASFARFNIGGEAATAMDASGFFMSIQGLSAGATSLFTTGITAATINAATTASLKIKVGDTTYYIPLATAIV